MNQKADARDDQEQRAAQAVDGEAPGDVHCPHVEPLEALRQGVAVGDVGDREGGAHEGREDRAAGNEVDVAAAQPVAQHLDESRATVGLRGDDEHVART